MRIDAHVHLIECLTSFSAHGEGRSLGDGRVELATGEVRRIIPEQLHSDCFTAEAGLSLMDSFGIDMGVVLQGGFYGFQNSYVMQSARRYPDRYYPVGALDPFCGRSGKILDHLVGDLGFRALKFEISENFGISGYHAGYRVDGPEMLPVYERAHEMGMTVVFDVGGVHQGSYQIEGLACMVRRFSNIRFVICHLLCPVSPDQDGWEQDMRRLMADNAWFEISSLPSFIGEDPPYTASAEYVQRALRLVGAGRLIWGSDAPMALNSHNYGDLLGYLQHAIPEGAIDDVLGGNAVIAYDMPKRRLP